MGKPKEAPDNGAVARTEAAPVALHGATLAAFEAAITQVPDAGGDAFESIVGAIMAAGDVADLDAPWRSQGGSELLGVPIVVRAIRKLPASYGEGLPWFLVVDAAIAETGELVTFTTGSVTVVAQLVSAWAKGWYPLACTLVESERESARGFHPQHLVISRRQPAPAGA